jgi:hypothetical protein
VPPEDNPADDQQPTQEDWDSWQAAQPVPLSEERVDEILEASTAPQRCPKCGKSEPDVTFDADTFSDCCDECVSFGRAFSDAYRKLDEEKP